MYSSSVTAYVFCHCFSLVTSLSHYFSFHVTACAFHHPPLYKPSHHTPILYSSSQLIPSITHPFKHHVCVPSLSTLYTNTYTHIYNSHAILFDHHVLSPLSLSCLNITFASHHSLLYTQIYIHTYLIHTLFCPSASKMNLSNGILRYIFLHSEPACSVPSPLHTYHCFLKKTLTTKFGQRYLLALNTCFVCRRWERCGFGGKELEGRGVLAGSRLFLSLGGCFWVRYLKSSVYQVKR